MGYRSDREVLRQQKEALEQEVASLRADLERERRGAEPESDEPQRPAEIGRHTSLPVPMLLAAALVALAWLEAGPLVGAIAAVLLLFTLALVTVVKRHLVVAAPHEALVVSGARQRLPDGSVRGWRLARGRVLRVPILQQIERIDLRAMPLVLVLDGVRGRDGAELDVVLHAIVRISSDPKILPNAVERFLGKPLEQVAVVARQTLEAAASALIAHLSPEELALERQQVAQTLSVESEPDLDKLGLALMGIWISEVSDRGGVLRACAARQVAAAETRADELERARGGP